MSLSSDRRAGRERVLSRRNGQAFVYLPFGQASHSASSSSSKFWSIFCFMPSRLGFLCVVLPPEIGANDLPASALWTVQRQAEILVLALVSAIAAEESGMIAHGQKERRGHPSPHTLSPLQRGSPDTRNLEPRPVGRAPQFRPGKRSNVADLRGTTTAQRKTDL